MPVYRLGLLSIHVRKNVSFKKDTLLCRCLRSCGARAASGQEGRKGLVDAFQKHRPMPPARGI